MTIALAAIAIGLGAHLLGESLAHDGSPRDLVLLLADVVVLRIRNTRILAATHVVLAVTVGAICVAVAWPFLEGSIPTSIQILGSLLWIIPLMLTFAAGVVIFAQESLAIVRAIIEIVSRMPAERSDSAIRFLPIEAVSPIARTVLRRLYRRRGPPVLASRLATST